LQWLSLPCQRRNRPSVLSALLSDLKPANIMLSKGVVKIGDFGFAKKNVSKRIKNATSVGTPLYMPLQLLKS
jgi:serine/threonine-protein kinase ULK/ATG1